MTSFRSFAVAVAFACSAAACGGSDSQQAPAQTPPSTEQAQSGGQGQMQGVEEMAKGFEAMAKGLTAATGGGDAKPVDPVSFRELQTVMPEISGWERTNPTGERMTSPFSFSQATVTYRKGDASVEQKIVDSGFNQLLFAPFSMFMVAGYEKETQDGYERSVSIGGNPGWEKWDKGSRNGELSVVVNKRFLVQLEGSDLDDIKLLHDVLAQTDLTKLAALR